MVAITPSKRRSHHGRRARRRLVRHHLVFGTISVILTAAILAVLPPQTTAWRLSVATAYSGLALLAATLLTGPANVLRARPNPVSTDLRRDLGIWAGIVGLAHVIFGLQVHLEGKFWRYFLERLGGSGVWFPRIDLFGFANYTGLLATFIILLLLGLSNDWTLRALGRHRWKALQRTNYGLAAVVAAHAIAYQISERRAGFYLTTLGAVLALVIVVQLAGFQRRRQSGQRRLAQNKETA